MYYFVFNTGKKAEKNIINSKSGDVSNGDDSDRAMQVMMTLMIQFFLIVKKSFEKQNPLIFYYRSHNFVMFNV